MTARCPKCGKTIPKANLLWDFPTVHIDLTGETDLPTLNYGNHEGYRYFVCACGERLYIKREGEELETKKVRVLTWEKFRAEDNRKLLEKRSPVDIKIHSLYSLLYGAGRSKISSITRNVKGREYISPRVYLKDYFSKHIGKGCVLLEGKASIKDWNWLDAKDASYDYKDVIVLVIEDKKKKPSGSEFRAKEEARRFVAESTKRLTRVRGEMEKTLTPPKN